MLERLHDEVKNASHGVIKMVVAIQSPEWTYHALRGEQHILDVRLGKLIDEWASNTDMNGLETDPQATEPTEIDFAMTAYPDELIAAFGSFTGMDESWFVRWQDKSGLNQSIAKKGERGKHSTEPRFYVFPVMQWLIGKPKIGRPIQEVTAWRILENRFKKVYAAYQSFDPRHSG